MPPHLPAIFFAVLWSLAMGACGAERVEEVEQRGSMREKTGSVTYRHPNTPPQPARVPQPLDFDDQLDTSQLSWAVVEFPDARYFRLKELTVLRVVRRQTMTSRAAAQIVKGAAYYAGHARDGDTQLLAGDNVVRPKGTEFLIEVTEQATRVVMFDGQAELENDRGKVLIQTGDVGIAEPGQPPRTARIETINLVQWWLYYPAVHDPDELPFSNEERAALNASLTAYRRGNLLEALRQYPGEPGVPELTSDAQKVYYAGLLLAVGAVDRAEGVLERLPRTSENPVPGEQSLPAGLTSPPKPWRRREPGLRTGVHAGLQSALRRLIAAVNLRPAPEFPEPNSASEWLGQSYVEQSAHDLDRALAAARKAVENSPKFAFGLARVAELEFSFGRTPEARAALDQALALAPEHAQAHALHGFLMAAQNNMRAAIRSFDEAIRLDPGLGNGWLGRGLSRLRIGQRALGLADLETAALFEPNRSLLHSYLGKAYQQSNRPVPAFKELDFAQRLDPDDPTAWLYSALGKAQGNRINEAISDLERSTELNDNRAVYRSGLLLDQDSAVRAANLAQLYSDAAMEEAGLRQAARSVNADYGNFSGHLFLANSYNALLDPGRVNLRFETAATSEYLLANVLAPVGAGILSPTISQQEYSKLFAQDGPGVVSSTEYLSRGSWKQQGALYGTYGNASASFDALYLEDNGQRPNNDLELTAYAAQWKQQVTSQDQVFGQVLWSDSDAGDRVPRYDPHRSIRGLSVEERQEPIVLAGYQHQWSPGSRTLALASFMNDRLEVGNPTRSALIVDLDPSGAAASVRDWVYAQDYESELNVASFEAQQIFEQGPHRLIAGVRAQTGDFDVSNDDLPVPGGLLEPRGVPGVYAGLNDDFDQDFTRTDVYAYYRWRAAEALALEAGLNYAWMKFPSNFRYAPVLEDESTQDQISPKAGLIWNPADRTTVLASYARSLSGVSLEQSFRLEPSQISGLNQAYRSVMPDAVAGANAAEDVDALSVLVDHRFPTRTYLGLTALYLHSDTDREVGVYDAPAPGFPPSPIFFVASSTTQGLDYDETAVGLTLNQLIDDAWSVGASYRVSQAQLESDFKDIPSGTPNFTVNGFKPEDSQEAWLHQVRLWGVYNHPSGFFSGAEALWFQQSNQSYATDLAGDDFWQGNVWAGWRLFRRRAELALGVLNVADHNYRLNPLNLAPDLPRERTFMARARWNF